MDFYYKIILRFIGIHGYKFETRFILNTSNPYTKDELVEAVTEAKTLCNLTEDDLDYNEYMVWNRNSSDQENLGKLINAICMVTCGQPFEFGEIEEDDYITIEGPYGILVRQ